MAQDYDSFVKARPLFHILCDVESLLGMAAITPLFEAVQSLMKFSQSRDVYVGDFVAAVKICQLELSHLYVEPETRYHSDVFTLFLGLQNCSSQSVLMKWVCDLNYDGVEHLCFESTKVSKNIWATVVDNGKTMQVTQDLLATTAQKVREATSKVVWSLISELDARFPTNHIMDALGIVFPQYWAHEDADKTFINHLTILKEAFCHPRSVKERVQEDGSDGEVKWAPQILSANALDEEQILLRMSIKANWKGVMTPPYTVNPLSCIWQIFSSNTVLRGGFPEYFKVAEIAIVLLLGSIEDERAFSTVGFVKGKLRNKLGEHLPLCVSMFSQKFWTLQNFPYAEACKIWRAEKHRFCIGVVVGR